MSQPLNATPPDGEYRTNPKFDDADADPTKHIGLARACAMRYRWAVGQHMDFDDLVQAGCLGLVQASQRYDGERGRFSTYAYYWVMQSIRRAVAYALYEMHNMSRPTEKSAHGKCIVSVDSVIAANGGEPSEMACRSNADPDSAVRSLVATFRGISRGLNERQRLIAARRYICGWTLDRIGAEIGVTRERARQILSQEIDPHIRINAIVGGYVEREEAVA